MIRELLVTPPVSVAAGRAWPVALLLGSASFLVLFDSLAIATALPSIGAEFGLRPGVLQWVVSLYSVGIGAFLLLGGRVCDLWDRRRALVASLLLCAVAGLVAGLAENLPVLLAGRVFQGLAAAFALPAAFAIAGTLFTEEPWRSRGFSVMAFAAWSAGLVGAMLGGLITVHWGWRWVFLVTVPVGVVAVVAAMFLLPPVTPPRDAAERLDVWGALLTSVGLVVLILGLERLGKGEGSGLSWLIVCAALAVFAVLVVVERRTAYPLVKPGLLRSRRLVGSCLAFGGYCAGYTVVIVIGSQYLQDVHGLSAAGAGVALTPVLVGGIVSSLLAPVVLRRFAPRVVLTVALMLCALAVAMIALLGQVGVFAMVPWFALWGAVSGPIFVAFTRECITDSAEEDRGVASAMFESMSHVGGAIAIAVYMTMLGAGFSYRSTQFLGVAVVAASAVLAFLAFGPGRGRGVAAGGTIPGLRT
jgi:predicted MFS family arabinose efflux permease